eukprot:385464-Hanusia_phi.AAC.2
MTRGELRKRSARREGRTRTGSHGSSDRLTHQLELLEGRTSSELLELLRLHARLVDEGESRTTGVVPAMEEEDEIVVEGAYVACGACYSKGRRSSAVEWLPAHRRKLMETSVQVMSSLERVAAISSSLFHLPASSQLPQCCRRLLLFNDILLITREEAISSEAWRGQEVASVGSWLRTKGKYEVVEARWSLAEASLHDKTNFLLDPQVEESMVEVRSSQHCSTLLLFSSPTAKQAFLSIASRAASDAQQLTEASFE